ncbi:hypothetical protein FQZ97_961150 [compost metagenome]
MLSLFFGQTFFKFCDVLVRSPILCIDLLKADSRRSQLLTGLVRIQDILELQPRQTPIDIDMFIWQEQMCWRGIERIPVAVRPAI